MRILKSIKLVYLSLLISLVNLILYHYPFYKFVCGHFDIRSSNGIMLLISLTTVAIIMDALFFYLILYLLRTIGKWFLALFFIINSLCIYFINAYGVIIDETMIGNILNTNYQESSSFLSLGVVLYLIFLGVVPSVLLFMVKILPAKPKRFLLQVVLTLTFLLTIIFANSSNWLWVDKNSKTLGGLVMPWSYIVNTSLFYVHKNKVNEKEILLPSATIMDSVKSVAVLVIGESARSSNFSLYGYTKDTNPLLSKIENVRHFNAQSCATYTTAGVKCILEHERSSKLYEILPNYLYRNGVEVIWRTTNWGEPPVHIKNHETRQYLKGLCTGDQCSYDEILLSGLKEEIAASKKNKILVILHTSTSHGPTYNQKYPKEFEKFSPVCQSVELANCSHQELVNAYDNTIVYTDYILAKLIGQLKELKGYKTSMIFISDHGESLGENNLYMHGIPASIAPKEQLDIPFIVWHSAGSRTIRNSQEYSQQNIFHSVLDFLAIDSPIYNENLSIYKK